MHNCIWFCNSQCNSLCSLHFGLISRNKCRCATSCMRRLFWKNLRAYFKFEIVMDVQYAIIFALANIHQKIWHFVNYIKNKRWRTDIAIICAHVFYLQKWLCFCMYITKFASGYFIACIYAFFHTSKRCTSTLLIIFVALCGHLHFGVLCRSIIRKITAI